MCSSLVAVGRWCPGAGSGPLGCAFEGYPLSPASSPLCLLTTIRWTAFLGHLLPAGSCITQTSCLQLTQTEPSVIVSQNKLSPSKLILSSILSQRQKSCLTQRIKREQRAQNRLGGQRRLGMGGDRPCHLLSSWRRLRLEQTLSSSSGEPAARAVCIIESSKRFSIVALE